MGDYTSMNRNASYTVPSKKSPLSPRLKPSPFSKRTVDQCPVYKKSQSGSPEESGDVVLTSYDKAQLRRSLGDQLNQKMYPKSWEMANERQGPENPGKYCNYLLKFQKLFQCIMSELPLSLINT